MARLESACRVKDISKRDTAAALLQPSYTQNDYAELLLSNVYRRDNFRKRIPIRQGAKRAYECEWEPEQNGEVSSEEKFVEDTYESLYYNSRKVAPLGKCRIPTTLPENINTDDTIFGVLTKSSEPAYDVILPKRSRDDILHEDLRGHKNYIISHVDYFPGEQIRRNYDKKSYDSETRFGQVKAADTTGKNVKSAMMACPRNDHCLINCIQSDYQRHTKSQLAKPLERLGIQRTLPSDFTCGVSTASGVYRARHVIYNRIPSPYRDYLFKCVAHIYMMRILLGKKRDVYVFDLYKICESKDTKNTQYLPWDVVLPILYSFGMRLDKEKTKFLCAHYRIVNEKDEVNYSRLLQLLDRRLPLPHFGRAGQNHDTLRDYINTTTYQEQCADLCKIPDSEVVPAGVSSDQCNEDEVTDMREIINPSIMSWYGVDFKECLIPRSKEEIKNIFLSVGFQLDHENLFEHAWNNAIKIQQSSNGDKVSVETFLHALKTSEKDNISFKSRVNNKQSTE